MLQSYRLLTDWQIHSDWVLYWPHYRSRLNAFLRSYYLWKIFCFTNDGSYQGQFSFQVTALFLFKPKYTFSHYDTRLSYKIKIKYVLKSCSFLLLVSYNFSTFFEITTIIDPETNSTVIAGTSLRRNEIYFAAHKVYAKILIDLFAYVVIIVLNTFIFIKIMHSTNLGKAPTNGYNPTIRRNSYNIPRRNSSIISTNYEDRKYSTTSTNHTVYLNVPSSDPNPNAPRRVSRHVGRY